VLLRRAPGSREAFGGPQTSIIDVGPFATLAEAERMRHVLKDVALAVIDNTGTDDLPAYRVRAVPINGLATDAAGAQTGSLGEPVGAPASR
jgi:hypothetical protein